MRAAILFCMSLIAAAAAHADVSYGVFGVRAGDTLNVRAQAHPRAPVVTTIPHDGDGIALTGRTAPGDWVEVTYRRKRGWVNGRFLGFGNGRWALPAHLDCSGTEPFWSIRLAPGQARADLLFTERRYFYRLTRAQPAMNRTDVMLIRGAGRPGGEMSLIVRHEVCSDGMSDTRYPYSALVLISGLDMIAGCCRPALPR